MLQLQFMQPSILSCNNQTPTQTQTRWRSCWRQSEIAVGKVGTSKSSSNNNNGGSKNSNRNARWHPKL